MREQIFDGAGGPFDPDMARDAPEACVICEGELPETADGGVGFNDDGSTCSESCHAEHQRREAAHRAEEQAADEGFARYCEEMAREQEGDGG